MRKVLEILPTVTCVKPTDALSLMSLAVADSTKIVRDQKTCSSETFQRVYQYLRRHVANSNLDSFAFDHNNIEGTPHDCLQILLRLVRGTVFIIKLSSVFFRFCGIKDPSWAEIRHFVTFLDLQLQSCERSYFTNPEFVQDVMDGFKSFVVRFMIQMSRVRTFLSENICLMGLWVFLTLGLLHVLP